VSEKDPVVKQKLSFLMFAGEDCLYFERAIEASCIDMPFTKGIAKMSSLRLN
jgi:hypothetical protein